MPIGQWSGATMDSSCRRSVLSLPHSLHLADVALSTGERRRDALRSPAHLPAGFRLQRHYKLESSQYGLVRPTRGPRWGQVRVGESPDYGAVALLAAVTVGCWLGSVTVHVTGSVVATQ